MSLKARVIHGVKWNTVSVVVNTIIQVLRIVILSRLLDVSDFGILAIAMAIVSFTEIFSDLGFTIPIIHKQNITKEQYSSVFWLNIILSIAITCILILIAPYMGKLYNEAELPSVIYALSSIVTINAFGKIFHTIKTKEMQFRFISIVSIVSALIGFGAMVVMALMDWGIWSLVIGTIIQTVVRQSTYFISGLHSSTIRFYLKFKDISDFIRIGSYQVGAMIMDFIANKVDVFILGKVLGMEHLGIYNLAKEFILKIYAIFVSISRNVASASFAKIQNNTAKLIDFFSKFSTLYAFVIVPCFCLVYLFPGEFSSIMYGDKANFITHPLMILSIYGVFTALCVPSSALIIALGKTNLSLRWTIICAIVNSSGVIISSRWGFQAILFTQIIISILLYILNWLLNVKPMIGMSLREYIRAQYASVLIAIPFIALIKLLGQIVPNSKIWVVVFSLCFCLLYLATTMAVNKISPKDFYYKLKSSR